MKQKMITFSHFYTLKLSVITNKLKHLFTENQLLLVFLQTMKELN